MSRKSGMSKKIKNLEQFREVSIYVITYLVSFVLSRMGYHMASGILLALLALVIYGIRIWQTGSIVDLKGLLGLSWIGGQGLACLQLSKLQSDWHVITWICFGMIYPIFCLGYTTMENREKIKVPKWQKKRWKRDKEQARRILICAVGLAVVSVVAFVVEAVVVGFIPIFSDLPHAYSYFHVSGVHYFTISCILIPAMTVIYSKVCVQTKTTEVVLLVVSNLIAVAVPILCVSRFQLLFAVGFAFVTYMVLYERIPVQVVIVLIVLMIPAYFLLTKARNHDVTYLNGIFEMKNGQTPIFITQPYMYVANNYENFNCMVTQLTSHTFGLKMLFPVFALTGLKFVYPQLVTFPMYITKQELTTLTMFYDAYYDFGIIGILAFSLLLGIVAHGVKKWIQKSQNPMAVMFYGQIAIYFVLSFFTTWFSNPTTWFWLALTAVMYGFVGHRGRGRGLI